MSIRKSVIVWSVGLVCAGALAGCGGGQHKHQPIDTSRVFEVKSKMGPGFQSTTDGPGDIKAKLMAQQKLPDGVSVSPGACRDYISRGRVPEGTRGRMSTLTLQGAGNQIGVIAVQGDKPIRFDAEQAKQCDHVTFQAGTLSGYIDETDAPQIDGVETTGSRWQLANETKEGDKRSTEIYYYAAYLGDVMVLVTANAMPAPGQPVATVDVDRTRQVLTDAVAALRD